MVSEPNFGVIEASGAGGKPRVNEATTAQIVEHRDSVFSDDANRQLVSTQHFRRLLSIEKNPPIQQVIDSGVVPRFVQFLQVSQMNKKDLLNPFSLK